MAYFWLLILVPAAPTNGDFYTLILWKFKILLLLVPNFFLYKFCPKYDTVTSQLNSVWCIKIRMSSVEYTDDSSFRMERSLGLLTTKFVSLLQNSKDGILDLIMVSSNTDHFICYRHPSSTLVSKYNHKEYLTEIVEVSKNKFGCTVWRMGGLIYRRYCPLP